MQTVDEKLNALETLVADENTSLGEIKETIKNVVPTYHENNK